MGKKERREVEKTKENEALMNGNVESACKCRNNKVMQLQIAFH